MGSEYSCFGNNTTKDAKTMDEYKIEENVKQHAEVEINEEKEEKEEEIQLIIKPEEAPVIQGAVRGYLTRKQFKDPLSQARESRSWFNVEKAYELVEKPLTEFQSAAVAMLEGHLAPLHIEKPEDGVPVVSKPALKLKDGSVYEGEWDKQGHQHGLGTLLKDDGSKVIGCFKSGLLEGIGRVIESTGLVIDGEFKNGELNGNAKIQNKSGGKFDGELAHGKLHGKGSETWPDGTKYEGEYFEGTRHGEGILQLPDGSTYKGMFKMGNMEGKGELSYKNGNKYTGRFKNSKMHGKGVFLWADGRKYEGEFKNDVKDGKGKMHWVDGKIYDGEWKEGVQHGEAEYTFKDKEGKTVTRRSVWENGSRLNWVE